MNKKLLFSVLTVVILAAAWFGYLAYCAHLNLVTLDVRNMDVREVVKKIERQTWEKLLLDTNVQGSLTLDVHKMPLEEVLNIIDDQISARWTAIYPLYTTAQSLLALKKAVRGEVPTPVAGWTNWQGRFGFRGGGFGGGGGPGGPGGGSAFGDTVRNENRLVSLHIENKDVQFATLALGRYAQARVVPEDGTLATVNLKLNQVTVPDAVALLAKQARRSWTRLYVLQGFGGRGNQFAGGDRGDGPPRADEGDRRGRGDWGNLTQEQRDERRKERETLDEELKQTLPLEARQKIDLAQQQQDQLRQELQNMTPEQRRDRFSQMAGGGGNRDQRNLSRIKNTTPEQRADRYRAYEERRQRGGGQRPPR